MKPISTMLSLLMLAGAGFAIGEYDFSDNVSPSQNPPNGLRADQVPMFITLGVDDLDQSGDSEDDQAVGPMGMRYLINYFRDLQNPTGAGNAATFDGSPTRISFYLSSVYVAMQGADNPNLIKWIINEAWRDGHEIGNHSSSHGEQIKKGNLDFLLNNEILECNKWLTMPLPPKTQETYVYKADQGCGIPAEEITGWRTPFLAYANDMLPALKAAGFTYDCSIEEGNSHEQDGTDFRWPYTLDNGSPGHLEGWSGSVDNPARVDVPNVTGLWQLPNHVAMLPPDELCAQYGVSYSIRQKMKDAATAKKPNQEWFTSTTDRFTNFDYNFWSQFGLNGNDVTAILKYTLDKRLEGNRAPLMIGAHDAWFHATKDKVPGVNTTYLDRQKAYADFFEYALTKPEVRIVTGRDIIKWCQNPVALDDIHYKVNLTVVPDTVRTPNSGNYPVWDPEVRYQSDKDTVIHGENIWIPSGWNYDNIGKEPGSHEFWNDGGYNGTVEVSVPGKVVRDADVVRKDGSLAYRFIPEAGNQVVELRINGEWVEPQESFTFSSVSENQSLQVKFGSGSVSINETGKYSRVKSIRPVVTGITGNNINLSIPNEGFYSVSIMGLNGRKLFNRNLALTQGTSSISLDGLKISNQMLIIEIRSNGIKNVQKLLVK